MLRVTQQKLEDSEKQAEQLVVEKRELADQVSKVSAQELELRHQLADASQLAEATVVQF
jgi:hypothetical protein